VSIWVKITDNEVEHVGQLPHAWRRPDGRWVTGLDGDPDLARQLGWVELDDSPADAGMILERVDVIDNRPMARWAAPPTSLPSPLDVDQRVAVVEHELEGLRRRVAALEAAVVARGIITQAELLASDGET